MDGERMVRRKTRGYSRGASTSIRVAPEFVRLIQLIKSEHLVKGRKAPTVEKITKRMTAILRKEENYAVLKR